MMKEALQRTPEFKALFDRWLEISPQINSPWTSPEKRKRLKDEAFNLERTARAKYGVILDNPDFFLAPTTFAYLDADKNFKIQIDHRQPLNLKVILKEVKEAVLLLQSAQGIKQKRLHPRIAERRFKVWDLRSAGATSLQIALSLKHLYPPGKSLEALVDNVKKDYARAYETIYNRPFRKSTGLDLQEPLPCNSCRTPRKKCKPRKCLKLEKFLGRIDVKQQAILAGLLDIDPHDLKRGKQLKRTAVEDKDEADF